MTESADRLVRRASVAASAGLALMLVATVLYIGWPRVTSALGLSSKPAPRPAAYAAGQTIDVPAAWYADAPKTLVIFARESCAACQRAQPFLASLVSKMQGHGGVLMAHAPGADADDLKFGVSLGLPADRVFITPPNLRVHATPTLVLVDAQGHILDAWEGVAKDDVQAAILKAIDAR